MKNQFKKAFPYVMFLTAWAVIFAAVLLGERIPKRSETDERNIAIREKAAMSSWYWTLYLLWAVFFVIQIFVGGLWAVAVSVVVVLHCMFYMINIYRWTKKM